MTRLRRSNCASAGYTRRRAGRGWRYFDAAGHPVTDPDVLDRIRGLAIPPAWSDVWICPWPNGHLQAVGVDARGRRQYRYHDAWRTRRDQAKFDHMLDFARALPRMRRRVTADLAADGMGRDRVLATAVRLLDLGFFRIGGESYAEENGTFGLATMLKRHARINGDLVVFEYVAKAGKRRLQAVADPSVRQVVAALKARRGGGPELLAYRDGRRWCDVRSTDINAYIKDAAGDDFSAKDFRTWNATVLTAVALAVSFPSVASRTARQRAVSRAMREVAHYLGNTPAVCRNSYVDPRVVDRFQAGVTISHRLDRLATVAVGELSTHGAIERAVVTLLEDPDADEVAAA